MNIKPKYFFPFLFLIYVEGNAQVFKRTIKWSDQQFESTRDSLLTPKTISKYLYFDNAVYADPISMLPYYFEIIPISYPGDNISDLIISLDQIKYEEFNDIEKSKAANSKSLKVNEPVFQLYRSRGINNLLITIPAIRTNNIIGLEKLVSFNLNVQIPNKDKVTLSKQNANTSSVLNTGKWIRIKTDKTGVFKITYSELNSWGLSNLSNVSVWGHGGRKLPYLNNVKSPDDLSQLPVYVEMGNDGVFNQGDFILFYAEGPLTWIYNSTKGVFTHEYHPYSRKICYFITTDSPSPKRIVNYESSGSPQTYQSGYFDELKAFEKNDTNLIKSGREWFGESFDIYTNQSFNTQLSNAEPGSVVKLSIRVSARSSLASSYSVSLNQSTIGSINLNPVSIGDEEADYVSVNSRDFVVPAPSGDMIIGLTFNKPSLSANGWLDYISLNTRQKLAYQGKQLIFRDIKSVGEANISSFTIEDANSNVSVWDVSNIYSTSSVSTNLIGNTLSFVVPTDSLRTFIAFEPGIAYQIEFDKEIPNQNLHGMENPDMVIVTSPVFYDAATELAEIHRSNDDLTVEVVTDDQVYNEFSSGNRDVSAIRNFMRMLYNRSTGVDDMPKYLLLYGDGSYNNISDKKGNTNLLPTYQSATSISKVQSFVTDDYFGLLDPNEGEADGLLDIGIGRLPVSTLEEAENVLSKIREYQSSNTLGDWNKQLCFIGDDEDGNLHMDNANTLADFVKKNHPIYDIQKIFFDAYPQQSTSVGERYPDVTNAINNRINNGALIVNYTGHGNEQWLSHEKVLMLNDVQSWRNIQKLPLFVTATCEFSRFDDYNLTSTGEWVLLSPNGGGIGLISTTRLVYSSANFTLNYSFISTVFNEIAKSIGSTDKSADRFYRLGDVIRITKNISGSGYNKRNFMLLGDPAIMLRYPEERIEITHLNDVTIDQPLDTLKALGKVKINGRVALSDGSTATDFNGQATISFYDKEKTLSTIGNDGNVPMNFTVRDNLVYKGTATVANGLFSLRFILPKDINYKFGTGRFSLFALNENTSAAGYNETIVIGGINPSPDVDNVGPDMQIYLNDEKFVPGGISDPNPKLIIKLADSSGINTTGNSIGHDLMAFITGVEEVDYVLNSYYTSETDNYQKGKVEFQLAGLDKGDYKVRIKAWDIFNNSSEKEIAFIVTEDQKLKITHLLNYPNPFIHNTAFYFEHNQPMADFEILIQIFSSSGKLVKTIHHNESSATGYRIGPISWDGYDDFGSKIGRGVYFYKLRIRTSNGKSADYYQKLVILK